VADPVTQERYIALVALCAPKPVPRTRCLQGATDSCHMARAFHRLVTIPIYNHWEGKASGEEDSDE